MVKRFFNGMIFGLGFSIAFITISYAGVSFLILPKVMGPQEFEVARNPKGQELMHEESFNAESKNELKLPFHELTLDEQIKNSSVIVLTKYEKIEDGKVKSIISDILKHEGGATFYYSVGDEYHDSSFYPRDDIHYGDGQVVFFVGSPASMRMSMSYNGDRIGSLGDIPIELFRAKCSADES